MNTKCPVIVTTLLAFFSSTAVLQGQSQESGSREGVVIVDFDGNGDFAEYDFSGPEGQDVDYTTRYHEGDTLLVKQGEASRQIRWTLKREEYIGWGVILKQGNQGFDVNQIQSVTFWVFGSQGGERFKIELKDTKGVKKALMSRRYLSTRSAWQKVCINLRDFGREIDYSLLEAFTLVFDRTTSGETGNIYVDDFRFEFSACQ